MKTSHDFFLLKHGWLFVVSCTLMIALGLFLLRYPHLCGDYSDYNGGLILRIQNGLENCCHDEHSETIERRDGVIHEEEIQDRREEFGASTGDLTISLKWDNTDDLDLAVVLPNRRDTIFYANRIHSSGGRLDVDKNAMSRSDRSGSRPVNNPIENIFWTGTPPTGKYQILVSLYGRRTRSNRSIPYIIEVNQRGEKKYYSGSVSGSRQKFTNQNIDLYVQ